MIMEGLLGRALLEQQKLVLGKQKGRRILYSLERVAKFIIRGVVTESSSETD